MVKANIDHLVLGCTHYPYLIPMLKTMLPPQVQIIDSGAAVAKQTMSLLLRSDLLNKSKDTPTINFYSNTDTKTLKTLLNTPYSMELLEF